MNAIVLLKNGGRVVGLSRVFTPSRLRLSHTKTAIQEFGAEYLKRQTLLHRPISPHLTVYRPQLTWMMSGAHRFCGCFMAGALGVGGFGFMVLPWSFTDFVNGIRWLNPPRIFTDVFKFIIAFPIIYYTLNEIRMTGFEFGIGTRLPQVYRSGKTVLALTFLLSLFVVLNAKRTTPGIAAVESQKSKY